MGRDSSTPSQGERKKVARLCRYIELVILNGEIPPLPKDSAEAEFLQSRGVVILQGDDERALVELFFKAIEAKERGVGLNFRYCELFCERWGLDILGVWDTLTRMLNSANKALLKGLE